jgi:hypothetical protein
LQNAYRQAFDKLPYELQQWDLIETSRSEALTIARRYFAAKTSSTQVVDLDFNPVQVSSFHNQNAQDYPQWAGDAMVLLPDNLYGAAAAVFLKTDVAAPFVIEFEYSLFDDDGGTGEIWNSADGLTFMFLKNRAAYEVAGVTPPTGGGQGFIRDGTGYGVFFSIYGERRIELRDGDGNILTSSQYFVGATAPHIYTHGQWQPVRIEINRDGVNVDSGGERIFNWNGELSDTFAGVGFSAATGGADAEHKIRNIRLTLH